MDFSEFYTVRVTGTIISETPSVEVTALEAVVSTIDATHFKVWPVNDDDPQLPAKHNGKLWFSRKQATVEVISDENGDAV